MVDAALRAGKFIEYPADGETVDSHEGIPV